MGVCLDIYRLGEATLLSSGLAGLSGSGYRVGHAKLGQKNEGGTYRRVGQVVDTSLALG